MEIELLEIAQKDLENAIEHLSNALTSLKDIEGIDKEYADINSIMMILEDKSLDVKYELDNLKEEAYFKENEEIWKEEKKQEIYEYWREVI